MSTQYDHAAEAAAHIRRQLPNEREIPTVAVVLGSGLQLLADRLEKAVHLPYDTIPH